MTNLASQLGDDHAPASLKHATDARALFAASRFDGAAYLAGYAVECATKAVILLDKAYDPATKTIDSTALADWHKKLRVKPFGHELAKLLAEALSGVGTSYAHLLPSVALPPIPAIVTDWKETLRYREEHVGMSVAEDFVKAAESAGQVFVQMRLDGVL